MLIAREIVYVEMEIYSLGQKSLRQMKNLFVSKYLIGKI